METEGSSGPPWYDRFVPVWRTLLAVTMIAPLVAGCSGHEKGNGTGTDAAAGTAGGGAAGASASAGSSGTGGGGIGGAGGEGASSAGGSGGGGASNVGGSGGGGASNVGGTGGGDAGRQDAGGDGEAVATGFSWRTLPSLAKKRQSPMGVALGETMYVIGGYDESGLLEDVERLDPGQAAWTAAPSLPNPQCCAAAGVLGSVIAVAGGYGSDGQTPTDALLLFDSTTGVWQSGPHMPTARVNAMGAVWNGKLAVIGGSTAFGSELVTGVIEIYDPASNSWTTSTLTVTPRASGVAVVDSDRIYVIGGVVQNSLYGDSIVEIVTADGVTAGPSLGLARAQVAGGLLPSGLMVAGGWTPALDTPTAEGLLGARTAWQSLPPMPTTRAGAAAAVVNGSLIVAGGGQFLHAAWVQQNVVEALAAD